jgi:hypothetical protein
LTKRFTTQIYVLSGAERAALQQYLINSALSASKTESESRAEDSGFIESLKTCIGAICEGSNLLATMFQPLVLSGALLGFLHKKNNLTREQLRLILLRLGVEFLMTASKEAMRALLEEEIGRLRSQSSETKGVFNLGKLSRVIALREEISKLVALPTPGYWDLPDAVSSLLSRRRRCPSENEVYDIYKSGELSALEGALVARNNCMYGLLKNIRKRVAPATTGGPLLLLSEAHPLASQFMDICQEDPLRKLFFMHQVCASYFTWLPRPDYQ